MLKKPLYTIGHGTRKPLDLLVLLRKYGIDFLIDVRSTPYSKFNPQFNQAELEVFLRDNGIRYVFMGDSLGGRPKDPGCYDEEGRVDYEEIKAKEFFIKGIDRLKTAYQKEVNVVLMCSESKPCECHRSKLIGRVLDTERVEVQHIDENGRVKDQAMVINEVNAGLSDTDLFGNNLNTGSRKVYN
jgi:uncharacterized protein (DUF488 family)